MADEKEGQKKKELGFENKTVTREFEGFGRFTTRGITAGENLQIQSDGMAINPQTREAVIDAKGISIRKLQTCLVQSPEGPHPPTIWLEKLPSGIVDVLVKTDIEGLSTPSSTLIKN
jgi:hypothetical protein